MFATSAIGLLVLLGFGADIQPITQQNLATTGGIDHIRMAASRNTPGLTSANFQHDGRYTPIPGVEPELTHALPCTLCLVHNLWISESLKEGSFFQLYRLKEICYLRGSKLAIRRTTKSPSMMRTLLRPVGPDRQNRHAKSITKERYRINKADMLGASPCQGNPHWFLAGHRIIKCKPPPGSWLHDLPCCVKECTTGDHSPGLAGLLSRFFLSFNM